MKRRRGSLIELLLMSASSIVVALPLPSLAQSPQSPPDTTTEEEQKPPAAETIEPAPATLRKWLERRVRALAGSTSDRARGFSITAGSVVSGSGVAAGLGYKHLNAFPGGIGFQIDGRVSVRRYQEYAAAIGFLNARASTVELDTADRPFGSLFNDASAKRPGSALYVEARYRHYPQHSYYGDGIGARVADRADYLLSGISVEGVWQRQFTPTVGMSVRGGVLDFDVGNGTNPALVNFEERFVPAAVSGALAQPRFVTLGAGIVRDTRQQPGAPDDGTFVGLAVRRFTTGGASDLDFTRLTLDVRAYSRPLTTRGVVALRGLLSSDIADSGGRTPFYLQQYLGGGDAIRGLRSYRYQDQSLFVVTAEYRWRIHRSVDVAPFIDAGNAAPALSRLTFRSLTISPGIAIHARTDRRTIARLEVATGPDGYRFTVGMGPAF